MPEFILPFRTVVNKPTIEAKPQMEDDSVTLPKPLRHIAEENPHLSKYLKMIPIADIGAPQFHLKLDRSMSKLNNLNIIYPISLKGNFAHVLQDTIEGRPYYIPIEPCFGVNVDMIMNEIEKRLLMDADRFHRMHLSDPEKRKEAFEQLLKDSCVIVEGEKVNPENRKNGHGLLRRNGDKRIPVTKTEYDALLYLIFRDKIGSGVIEPFLRDTYVEDISCSGIGVIFIEHKIFKSLKTNISFPTTEELDTFVIRLAEKVKKPVTVASPIVDATLPDGSRINIVYGSEVSKRGSNFTIRKFADTPLSVLELIELGTLNYQMAAYLSITIGEDMNVFVCGETASGKTTTLNAITTFIHPNAKIVSIEDTPELQVPHANWVREVVSTTKEGQQSGVTMFDLLKAALRQRPNEIIVGEIRGAEGAIAFQAMQTGHSVMATFHAASVERLIQRLTGNPINVPKTYIDNLNIVIIQQSVKLPNGKQGRRITSINEIVGYDPSTGSFTFVEAFRWDPVNDRHIFSGDGNSYILEHKIAPKLGIPPNKKRRIYAELDRRARILEKLHRQGITNFYEFLKVLAKAQREGLF